jgi:hypothetical protein
MGCVVPGCLYGPKMQRVGGLLVPMCFGHTVELANAGAAWFDARYGLDLAAVAGACEAAWRQGAAGSDTEALIYAIADHCREDSTALLGGSRCMDCERDFDSLVAFAEHVVEAIDSAALSAGAAPREPENVERPMTFQAFERQAREGGPR